MSEISDEDKWECYLCGWEDDFDQPAYGWLGDCHMLCLECADSVYIDSGSKYHQALTYHYEVGEIHTEPTRLENSRSHKFPLLRLVKPAS